MKTHRVLQLYLLSLHLSIAVAGVALLWREHRPWLLALEGFVLVSIFCGLKLVSAITTPEELVQIGSEWIRDGELTHSFRPHGAQDLRQLIELYNSMLSQLREERTRQTEQNIFLHKVLDASPSGIITSDHDGRIDLVNPSLVRLLEVEALELKGITPSDSSNPLIRQLAELRRGEVRIFGGARRLRCSHSSFFDRGFERSFYIVDDLTHELWATEKLAYETLIRILSHEVNNTIGATGSILQSALVYADRLPDDESEDFSSAIEVAIKRGHHLGVFMQRYADVVRMPEPNKQTSKLFDLLSRIVRLMEAECLQHEISLDLNMADNSVELNIDVVQIEQVLVNIIRNAMDAIDHNGEIVIAADDQNGRIRVSISDSGPGLSDEARSHLFVPFFTSKAHGQGIGLTLIREILSRHVCDFYLESPPQGPTRFVILFPA